MSERTIALYDATQHTDEYLKGDGVAFPATAVPSSDANVLDDYEEGTWTPSLSFVTAGDLSTVYSTQIGTYTKIGRVVVCHLFIALSTFTHTTASGEARISGLPFTCGALNTQGPVRMDNHDYSTAQDIMLEVVNSSTYARFLVNLDSAYVDTFDEANLLTGADLSVFANVVYYV